MHEVIGRTIAALALATLAVGAGALSGRAGPDLPEAVRGEFARRAAGHELEQVKVEHADGTLVYEARWSDGARVHEVVLDGDGRLVESEDGLDPSEVPAAVRAAAAARLPGPLAFARRTVVLYEAVSSAGDELLLRATGGELDEEALEGAPDDDDDDRAGRDDDDDDDDGEERAVDLGDVPAAVLAAARAALPGATFTAASTGTEDGLVLFELSGTLDGDEVEIELSADGTVVEIEKG